MATEAQTCAIGILANRRNAQRMDMSFLRRQESRVLDGPGFRIKCGMTARRASTNHNVNYAKQTQLLKSQNGRKHLLHRGIWKYIVHSESMKANPIKANFKIPQTHRRSGKKKGCQELFLGLNCRKGFNIVYGKSHFSLKFGESSFIVLSKRKFPLHRKVSCGVRG